MEYNEIFEDLGFSYVGPCSCRYKSGFIYRSNSVKGMEVWIYPKLKELKRKDFDHTVSQYRFTEQNIREQIMMISK